MGLFWTPATPAEREVPARGRVIRISQSQAKLLNCSHCSLDKDRNLGSPKLEPTGAQDGVAVYVIGSHLTREDDDRGEHFVDSSGVGRLLRRLIPERLLPFVRYNNVLRCHPTGEPKHLDIQCCRRLQVADIEAAAPDVIIALGADAVKWFLGDERSLYDWRGRRTPVKVGKHHAWLYVVETPTVIFAKQDDKKYGEAFMACFKRDMRRVFSDMEGGLPAPYVEPVVDAGNNIVSMMEYGQEGLKAIERHLEYFADVDNAVDIETDRLRPYTKGSRILSLAIGTYDNTMAFGWEHPECRWTGRERAEIGVMIYSYLLGKGRKWAHGAKFEQEWFHSRWGPDILYQVAWGDTLGQAHIIDERAMKKLGELTLLHFGFDVKKLSNLNMENLAGEPLSEVLPYNGMDTKYTDALSCLQADLLADAGLTEVYEARNAATASFVQMQAKGVARNVPEIERLGKHMEAEDNRIKRAILEDPDVVRYRAGGTRAFSPTSNPNLVSFFRDFLQVKAGGRKQNDKKYSVDEDALENIKHPVAKMLVQMRSNNKNHGYITPLDPNSRDTEAGKYVHGDGLVHASYSQYVTVSGRSACSDPNQQNYPIRTAEGRAVRRAYAVRDGYIWVSCDYGQIEVRIIASAAQCPVLIKEVFNDQDVHADWTYRIGKRFFPKRIGIKEERKAIRQVLKSSWTFANFYGNELKAVAYDCARNLQCPEITDVTLGPIFEEFWDKYKRVKVWQNEMMSDYWKLGYVETMTGQRRHEPMSRNEIGNHLSQGTAGHLVIDAQRRIAQYAYETEQPWLQPIMNIHDDLSFELPDDHRLEGSIETIAKMMCTGTYDFIKVPLTVEVSTGTSWADKVELHTFNSRDFQ